MLHISHNIIFYRKHKRLTLQDTANALEIPIGRLQSYTRAKSLPPVDMALKISDMIGVSIDVLVRVKLDESNYQLLRKEKEKEQSFFDTISTLNKRLSNIEKRVRQPLTKSLTKFPKNSTISKSAKIKSRS